MKKEKRFEKLKGAAMGAILTLILMAAVPAFARVAQETITVHFNNIQIAVDGRLVQTEYEPFIWQERTYLPVRAVAEAIGFDVTWEGTTNTVHLTSRASTNVVPNYPPHQPGQQGGITIPDNIVPRPPARTGGPANPTITARRAVELARDHLISIGVTSARFDYIYMDIEAGTWVWSVEFDGQGRSFEFYVNVNTGAFLKAPQISAVPMPTVPVITTAPSQPNTSPSQGSGQGSRPSNPAISLDRAIEIAYADLAARGINAAYRSNSGMSWERGQWVWELLFRTQGERMPFIEFYINVNNGSVVKFEWDD